MQQISLIRIIHLFFIGLVSLFSIAFIILIAGFLLPSPSGVASIIISHTIPKYPNAEDWSVEYAHKNFDSPTSSTYIILGTKDTAEQIFDFYTSELTKKGWKLIGRTKGPATKEKEPQTITFTKQFFSLHFSVETTKYNSIGRSIIYIRSY